MPRALLAAAVVLLGCLPSDAGKKGRFMSEQTKQAAAKLAEFDKSKEPLPLQLAAEQLMQVDLSKETEATKRLQLRRETLQLWLRLLATIDANTDPNFNRDDRPAVSMSPEDSPEAIQRNEQKASNYRLQVNVRRMDQKFMPWAERFIRMAYTTVPGDQRELRESIQRLIHNPERAAQLEQAATPHKP